jgi:hypothetical protein
MAAALVTTRRFLPPRSVEEQPACFVVIDANGQKSSISRTSLGGDPSEKRYH